MVSVVKNEAAKAAENGRSVNKSIIQNRRSGPKFKPARARPERVENSRLTDLARTLKERGEDVIGLAAGEPDFETPDVCAKAGIRAIERGKTKYSPNPGTVPLRAAICEKLKRENGVEYKPNEIVISNGAKQSVTQAVLTCCGPGDEVIVPAPYWVSYPEMVTLSGAEKVILKTDIKSQFFNHAGTVGKSNHAEIENVDFVFAVQSERSGVFQRDAGEDL